MSVTLTVLKTLALCQSSGDCPVVSHWMYRACRYGNSWAKQSFRMWLVMPSGDAAMRLLSKEHTPSIEISIGDIRGCGIGWTSDQFCGVGFVTPGEGWLGGGGCGAWVPLLPLDFC